MNRICASLPVSSVCGSQESPPPWAGSPAATVPCAQCHQRHSLLQGNIRGNLGSAGDLGTSPASHHRAFPDILRRTLCSLQKTREGRAWPAQPLPFPTPMPAATTLQELRRSDPAVLYMGHATGNKVPVSTAQAPCKQSNRLALLSCCQCPRRQP